MRWRGAGIVLMVCASSACFATRNDVRILQGDLLAFRTEAARADSARSRQIAQLMTALNASLVAISDSTKELGARLARFQGDTRQDMGSILNQLSEVQELTGQGQRRLQELRAAMEARNDQQPPPAVAAPSSSPGADTMKAQATPAPGAPGPAQLFQLGIQQKDQQSYASARAAFEELLKNYPTSDLVPEAQYWIGEMLSAEGKPTEADSAFQTVLTKYPRTRYAARSMFRLGQSLDRQKRCPEAQAMMARVVRDFPQSDEAVRAKEFHCTSR